MDTIVICTLTSLVVLCSGAATGNYGNNDLAGVPTAVAGFASVFGDKLGSLILAVGLLLFATSTILGWALYGTRCAEFLFGSKIIRPYQVLFCLVVIAGSVANLKLVWDISDTLNRPHGDPEPHRHPAAQPRGHQADEGALQRREDRQARISEHPVSCGGTDHAVRPAFRSPGEKRGENAEYFRRFPFTIEKSRGMISKRVKAREEHTRT